LPLFLYAYLSILLILIIIHLFSHKQSSDHHW